MQEVKIFINRLIKTIILSSILFYTINISIAQYFLIILCMWALLFLNYNIKKNLEIFDLFIITSLGNFISYIFVNKISNSLIFSERITWRCSIILSLFLLILSIYSLLLSLSKNNNSNNKKLLFKREKDLKRLLYYLDMFDIIGINAEWGTGKTFLINELKKKIKDDYEIVEIDILSCNLNELQLILIKEIEKIMYKNRIISKYSNKLKKFLADEKFMQKLWNLIFPENYSYSETIKGFKDELSRIDKKILIIYEDIDRISDKKIIKSIFGLSEKLSSNNIKIIYQYDEYKLNAIGFDSDYLEKYIPYKMNLTEMNFFEIIKFVLDQNDIDKNVLEIKDFEFMKEYNLKYRYNILQNKFGINNEIYLSFLNFSIRKVEHFIFELSSILKFEEYKGFEDTIISFFFVKHFIPRVYEKMNIEQGLVETLKFNVDSKSYTIIELIAMKESGELNEDKINNIFNDNENKINYCVLALFNYKHDKIIDSNTLQSILNEPSEALQNRTNNERKDRIIWNLLQSGKSKYTNYEYVAKKFIKDVLEKPKDKQSSAYKKFYNDLYYKDNKEVDNETIFKMGVPSFIELFKSFRILDATNQERIALIDIYFKVDQIKDITNEFVQTMNYCPLETNEEYIYILNRINELNIIGNINSEKSFSDFLKKYIGALTNRGYINTNTYHYINGNNIIEGKEKFIILEELKSIMKEINKLKNKICNDFQIKQLEEDLHIIVKFVEKMIELIKYEDPVISKSKNIIETSFSSRLPNQDEFERLKALKKNNNFNQEVEKSYLEGKIIPYEINKLIDKKIEQA
ncbi:TPA: hypothetical protein PTV43_000383 [Clostridium botulinum]|nr:hypothetical protein [Clostridium botulinum]